MLILLYFSMIKIQILLNNLAFKTDSIVYDIIARMTLFVVFILSLKDLLFIHLFILWIVIFWVKHYLWYVWNMFGLCFEIEIDQVLFSMCVISLCIHYFLLPVWILERAFNSSHYDVLFIVIVWLKCSI